MLEQGGAARFAVEDPRRRNLTYRLQASRAVLTSLFDQFGPVFFYRFGSVFEPRAGVPGLPPVCWTVVCQF